MAGHLQDMAGHKKNIKMNPKIFNKLEVGRGRLADRYMYHWRGLGLAVVPNRQPARGLFPKVRFSFYYSTRIIITTGSSDVKFRAQQRRNETSSTCNCNCASSRAGSPVRLVGIVRRVPRCISGRGPRYVLPQLLEDLVVAQESLGELHKIFPGGFRPRTGNHLEDPVIDLDHGVPCDAIKGLEEQQDIAEEKSFPLWHVLPVLVEMSANCRCLHRGREGGGGGQG
jgi:hypothetical protein